MRNRAMRCVLRAVITRPTVFVARVNEGVMPVDAPAADCCGPLALLFPSTLGPPREHYEEERRTAFVALSRAREELILSLAQCSRNGQLLAPSRFLCNIAEDAMEEAPPAAAPDGAAAAAECSAMEEGL